MMMLITPCLLLLALTHVNAIVPNGSRKPFVPSRPRAPGPPVKEKIKLLKGESNVSQPTVFDGHKAEYAIDGNIQTFSRTTVDSTEAPYVFIDLQNLYYVDSIKITNLHSKEYPLQNLNITVDGYQCESYDTINYEQTLEVKCNYPKGKSFASGRPLPRGSNLKIEMMVNPTSRIYLNEEGDEIVGYDQDVHYEEVAIWDDDGSELYIDQFDQILNLSEVEVWGYEA